MRGAGPMGSKGDQCRGACHCGTRQASICRRRNSYAAFCKINWERPTWMALDANEKTNMTRATVCYVIVASVFLRIAAGVLPSWLDQGSNQWRFGHEKFSQCRGAQHWSCQGPHIAAERVKSSSCLGSTITIRNSDQVKSTSLFSREAHRPVLQQEPLINSVLLSGTCSAPSQLSVVDWLDCSFPWRSAVGRDRLFHTYGAVPRLHHTPSRAQRLLSQCEVRKHISLPVTYFVVTVISADVDSEDNKIFICFSDLWFLLANLNPKP